MKLKVLSWNVWQGYHLPVIIDFLKSANADIIALQEVIEKDETNTAALIAEALGYEFVYYQAIQQTGLGLPQGNAIVSKHSIVNSKRHFLSSASLYVNTPESESRIAVETTINVGNDKVTVFTTHLAYSHKFQHSKMRDSQVDNLLKFLPNSKTILMGDFNSYPNSSYMDKLNKVMNNADSELTDPTWTVYPFEYGGFKETKLRHRLDYIFTSKDLQAEVFKVEKSNGSDHLPISAIILLPDLS